MTDDDVTWARALLGPANPVPGARTAPPAPTPLAHAAEPRRPRRRAVVLGALATAAAVVAAVAATALASGGTAGHPPAGTAAVFAAAATTQAARTADISVTVTTGGMSLSGQGAADLASGAGDFMVDLPGSFGQLEVRSTGGTLYLHVPPALTALAGGKAWASVKAPAPDPTSPITFDATWLLDRLRTVAGPVTTVGTGDTVHGDATTHYRATVDLSTTGAPRTVPVDVWVDAAGRLRKLTASLDASSTPLAGLGTVQLSTELWGFGTPVEVTAPPADQVGDATALLPAARHLLPGL
ncbi:MAG TPA: hypothetical protein VFA84_05240 [Acidimicrobiales bacterium]|nr:hypothetical protein [Acidimicrobiales bacterium]